MHGVTDHHTNFNLYHLGKRARNIYFGGKTLLNNAPKRPSFALNDCTAAAAVRQSQKKERPRRQPSVAQCSATPATVAATPPCSATPFQTTKFRCDTSRHGSMANRLGGGGRCDTKIFRGCSATPVLHLQNAIKSRKSAATRVARHV